MTKVKKVNIFISGCAVLLLGTGCDLTSTVDDGKRALSSKDTRLNVSEQKEDLNYDEKIVTDEYGVISYTRTEYDIEDILVYEDHPHLEQENNFTSEPLFTGHTRDKINAVVRERVEPANENSMIDVIVSFKTAFKMPRLPEMDATLPRESPPNQTIIDQRRVMLEEVALYREIERSPEVDMMKNAGCEIEEQYSFGNAIKARVPINVLDQIAAIPKVISIDPVEFDIAPPDSNPNNDIADGRTRINSYTYYNHGYDGRYYYAGMLDTGIYDDHVVFNNPDRILYYRDCVYGDYYCKCSTGTPPECDPNDIYPQGHGTATASIFTGNSNMGSAYTGATLGYLDSWKVYRLSTLLNVDAVLKAFERAAIADHLIMAAMDAYPCDHNCVVSLAADDAFDAGSIVVATNGNRGPGSGTVGSPANAHKVMGVGNYDIETLITEPNQARGPTGDNRYKPDFQCPTNTDTASNSCTTCKRIFGGTCGANPYAGSAALLLRDWYGSQGLGVEPGKIYAGLIAFGSNAYPFNNEEGSGDMVLGNLYCRQWIAGSRQINQSSSSYIYFNAYGQKDLQVAIWWPDEVSGVHNKVNLYVYNPTWGLEDYSISTWSVFQKAEKMGYMAGGQWKVRIYGSNIYQGPQTVYYLVYSKMYPYDCD